MRVRGTAPLRRTPFAGLRKAAVDDYPYNASVVLTDNSNIEAITKNETNGEKYIILVKNS